MSERMVTAPVLLVGFFSVTPLCLFVVQDLPDVEHTPASVRTYFPTVVHHHHYFDLPIPVIVDDLGVRRSLGKYS